MTNVKHTPGLVQLMALIAADLRNHMTPAPALSFAEWLTVLRELREVVDRQGIGRELLAIADEMRGIAAHRAEHDPHPDNALTSWAGRIERAVVGGETVETAMAAAIAKATGGRL